MFPTIVVDAYVLVRLLGRWCVAICGLPRQRVLSDSPKLLCCCCCLGLHPQLLPVELSTSCTLENKHLAHSFINISEPTTNISRLRYRISLELDNKLARLSSLLSIHLEPNFEPPLDLHSIAWAIPVLFS